MSIFQYSFSKLDNFFFIKLILRKILKLNLANTKKFNMNLAVFNHDYVSNDIIIDGIYEFKEITTIIEWLKFKKIKRNLFVDVGANIGNHSVFFSKFFKSVISFEPHNILFELLKFNTKRIKNIRILNFGLSNKNKKTKIYSINSNMGGSTLIKNKKADSHWIKLKKFDNYNFKKKIDVIKIDTEGHEIEVLEGMIKYLKKNYPIIIFECLKCNIKNGTSPAFIFLKKLNYKFYSIENFNKQTPNLFDRFFFLFEYLLLKKKYVVPIEKLKNKHYSVIIAEKQKVF